MDDADTNAVVPVNMNRKNVDMTMLLIVAFDERGSGRIAQAE